MKHETIQILFFISLIVGLPVGAILMGLWFKRVFKNIIKTPGFIGAKTFIYGIPGIVLFILCCIPCFYFANLLKKETHCEALIEANKGITKEDPDLIKDCNGLDIDELFRKYEAKK
jgi:ABC-type antimicrobial peptide transport system permease subunit